MSESCCSRHRSGNPPAIIVVEIQNVTTPLEFSSSRRRRTPQPYNAVELLLRQ
uniref:Uncharacterized protein n=1 Tax=Cucumis melo TaxID=3656 RepID=A0A9I9DII5_CUCME